MHKKECGQAYYQDLVKRILKKIISFFLNLKVFSTHFRTLYNFLKM
jgi:hypothetical protein